MKQVFPMDSRVTYDAEGRPSYDRAVSSKPLRSLFRKLFTTGVMPNPSDTCQVRAGGDGMTLIVSPGFAVLEGGLYLEDAARTLSVTAADPTFDRIDTVVLRWNENDAVRDCDLHVVAGVPARNPVRPALTREGSIYEIGLADIFVTKGVATITNEKITDTRMESSRCGIVSSVSEWDTTTIYQQIQSDLAGFKSNEQAEFMTWFNKMKDQLTEDAAGRLQTEVDDVRGQVDDVRRQIHTNLLNPTAPTQTVNGVTLTNNGDGTYTVNGTATGDIYFRLQQNFNISAGTYRLNCCVSPSYDGIYCYLQSDKMLINEVTGIATIPNSSDCRFILHIASGQVLTNEVIKPMLTTDLSANYDSFVKYSGDGRLNENVAALFDKVEEHEEEIEQINADLSESLYKTTGLKIKEITIPNVTLPPHSSPTDEYRLSLANDLPSNLQLFYVMACDFGKYAVPYIASSTSYLGLDVLDFANRSIVFRYSSDWNNVTQTLRMIVAYK